MIGEIIINAFLVTLMLTIAFFIINTRKVISTILLAGTYSLVAALMFVSLDAVDVAFTEASVGAGISTILFLAALSYLPKEETEEKFNIKHIYAICICTLVAGLLIWASYDLPLVGQLENPVHQHLSQDFIEGSRNHIGIPNVVTSILASYRGYDTFGETVVIYTAGIAVLVLLYDTVKNSSKIKSGKNKKMDNLILKVCTKVLFTPIILFGLYVQFHGDFGPGGGFQAGVIVAAAFILYAIVFSVEDCKVIMPPKLNFLLLALGAFLYGFVGIVGLILGDPYLSYDVLGSTKEAGQHLGILLVEFGVGLTVCNVMISLFYSFANFNFGKKNND